MKTQNEILTDVYEIIQASLIPAAISGEVYKKVRPTDSDLEDCVISLISGTVEKFVQDGALYVKIFFPDIFDNNTYYEDTLRGQTLEGLLFDLSETLIHTTGYFFRYLDREISIEPVQGAIHLQGAIHQHFITLKLNFKLTTQ